MAINQWTTLNPGDIMEPVKIGRFAGSDIAVYNISIQGTFAGTVSLERQFEGEDTWQTVYSWTEPTETAGIEAEKATSYRVNATGVTGGSAEVRLGR